MGVKIYHFYGYKGSFIENKKCNLIDMTKEKKERKENKNYLINKLDSLCLWLLQLKKPKLHSSFTLETLYSFWFNIFRLSLNGFALL